MLGIEISSFRRKKYSFFNNCLVLLMFLVSKLFLSMNKFFCLSFASLQLSLSNRSEIIFNISSLKVNLINQFLGVVKKFCVRASKVF